MTTRREFVRRGVALGGSAVLAPWLLPAASAKALGYVCPPCGCAMDGRVFEAPGTCPACGMTLIERDETPPPFEPPTLSTGRGAFLTAGGVGHEADRITVAYYMPTRFTTSSRILLVLPGAGRNAAEYRDAWVERAEAMNVLVAALGYSDADYDFAAYQLGGVITNLQIRNAPKPVNGAPPSVWHLRDEDISFTVNSQRETWIFPDFDRIFQFLVSVTGSAETRYDLFGHSAGAQILHRLPLFHPISKARRIVAANAGLYTMPSLDEPPIIGLRGTGVTERELATGLGAQLLVLLGELDNDGERGGIQLHTPLLDRHGADRLSRGKYFFAQGERRAQALGVPLEWSLRIVPGVGHDYRRMGEAAARELYGG